MHITGADRDFEMLISFDKWMLKNYPGKTKSRYYRDEYDAKCLDDISLWLSWHGKERYHKDGWGEEPGDKFK